MSNNSDKLNSIINDINDFHNKVEDITELSNVEFDHIKNRTLTIIDETKSLILPSNISTKLNTLSLIVNGYTKTLNDLSFSEGGMVKAFDYTPVLHNGKYFTKDNGVIAKFTNANFGKVLGIDKRQQGLIDDITDYDGKSILSLSKNPNVPQKNYLHNIDIKDKYSTLFDFRLNRFPVKTHNKKGITKQYTSRRSDIISFNYESNKKNTENLQNSISFGAMAPYGVKFSKKVPPVKPNQHNQEYFLRAIYQKSYSPFSIAASITYEKNKKLSLYTDYKFELGKFYNVRLDIEFVKGSKEYIDEFKTAIDNAITDARVFTYDGVTYSLDNYEEKSKEISSTLRDLAKPFEYALQTSREIFIFRDRTYNTIDDAQLALDNYKVYSEEYYQNFEYAIRTSKETFSINGATYNTIEDAQNYWNDYNNRFTYAIDKANERFTYAGRIYNTIEDANNEKEYRTSILNQLMQDWDDYQINNNVTDLKSTSLLFTDNGLPLFTSTYTSGTTSNTLTYNSKYAVINAIADKSAQIDKFIIAITTQQSRIDNDEFFNNPIVFDGVTYTKIGETTARQAAFTELERLDSIYQLAIDNRKLEVKSKNYFSTSVTYDNVTYTTIESATTVLDNFNLFSQTYISDFESTISRKTEDVSIGIYSSSSFIYDGVSYSNYEKSKITQSKLAELLQPVKSFELGIKLAAKNKITDFEDKVKRNQIIVSYSGQFYKYNDAIDAYKNISVLLSGYGKFGKSNLYKFTLYVDGKKQRISSTLNKIWGDKGKFLANKGAIAKRPGFNPIGSNEVLYHILEERAEKVARGKKVKKDTIPKVSEIDPILEKVLNKGISTDYSVSHIVKRLDFGKLVSVETVPYKVKFKNDYIDTNSLVTNIGEIDILDTKHGGYQQISQKTLLSNIHIFRENMRMYNKHLKLSEVKKYKKLYNNYLYKTNNGVDFGNVSIYYTKQKPKLSIIALDQNKLFGEEFVFEGTEFRVKGLKSGDRVESVTLSSPGTIQNVAYTHTGPIPVKGGAVPPVKVQKGGIVKDGYLIRPSNAQGVGLDKYDIHYNIGILRVYTGDK